MPVEDAAWDALDPAQRRRQTLDAVKRLLLRESQEQPLLLVFEDLHWIDAETQALLDSLVESLPTARILLLVNYRPEYRHAWGSKSYYTQLRIDPLAAESADELLAACSATTPSLEPLTALLIERTEGNPLFLEESVRSLVETGALVGERGAYRLTGPVGERAGAGHGPGGAGGPHRPPAARGEAAAPDGRRDRQGRAGRAAAGHRRRRRRTSSRRGLAALQAAEFLYEASLFPELEYTFKHALTHEVAYGSLLQERRTGAPRPDRRGDRAAVRRPPGRARRAAGAPRPARRASGRRRSRTRRAGGPEGDRALGRTARRCGWFEQALRPLPAASAETATRSSWRIDLRFDLRKRPGSSDEHGRTQDILREAEATRRGARRPPATWHVLTYQATYCGHGRYDEAIETGERAIAHRRTRSAILGYEPRP